VPEANTTKELDFAKDSKTYNRNDTEIETKTQGLQQLQRKRAKNTLKKPALLTTDSDKSNSC